MEFHDYEHDTAEVRGHDGRRAGCHRGVRRGANGFPANSPAAGGATITPNYKDADLGQIIQAVSEVTGKNFIVDPRVNAKVTMLSSTPMSAGAFYEAFLSVLQVYGYVAVPAGKVIKIVPNTDARQLPSRDLPDDINASSDEIVTQIVTLKNVSAAQLVPLLRPLIPQYGHLAAYPGGNMLIISDRSSNVSRILKIVERMDESGDEPYEIIPLKNATATDLVRTITQLNQGGGAAGAEGASSGVKVVADQRTNSILVSGERSLRLRIKALIVDLDQPRQGAGETEVRYLRYADAEKLAEKLKGQASASTKAQGRSAGLGGAPAQARHQRRRHLERRCQRHDLGRRPDQRTDPDRAAEDHEVADGSHRQARHPPRPGAGRGADRRGRRQQELRHRRAMDRGRQRLHDPGRHLEPAQSERRQHSRPRRGRGRRHRRHEPGRAPRLGIGASLAIGRYNGSTGTNFAALVQAIRSDGTSNVISTPSMITMNNEEAQVKVTQEIPLITGSYSSSTQSVGGTTSPFTTIQREEVGTILKVTPHISEGNAVQLKIEQEDSSPGAKLANSADISTNKRSIKTTVLIEDGGVIVLGGLMSDTVSESEDRVPGLGAIPIIGNLFKSRSGSRQKKNLLVFIRPKILRDDVQTEAHQRERATTRCAATSSR